jgi:hypothetical protein
MGAAPSTGTVCAFPFTSADAAPASLSDCTLTYATYLSPGYDALSGVLASASALLCITMTHRIYHLRLYAARKKFKLYKTPTLHFFAFAWLFGGLCFFEAIDLFGFRNWYPTWLYYVLDEVVAASLFSLLIVSSDFWARLARGAGNGRVGLPRVRRVGLIVASYVNFCGLIVVAVIDTAHFDIYEGVKSLVGSLILVTLVVMAWRPMRGMVKTLKAGHSSKDLPAASRRALQYVPHPAAQSLTLGAPRTLHRKFGQWTVLASLGAAGLFANAILALVGTGDAPKTSWAWNVPVAEQIDPIQIVLKALYMLIMVALYGFFRVPRLEAGHDGGGGGENKGSSTVEPHARGGGSAVPGSAPSAGTRSSRTSELKAHGASLMSSSLPAHLAVAPVEP